jgi:hypothetical protein
MIHISPGTKSVTEYCSTTYWKQLKDVINQISIGISYKSSDFMASYC